jgi:hypothetical protein
MKLVELTLPIINIVIGGCLWLYGMLDSCVIYLCCCLVGFGILLEMRERKSAFGKEKDTYM